MSKKTIKSKSHLKAKAIAVGMLSTVLLVVAAPSARAINNVFSGGTLSSSANKLVEDFKNNSIIKNIVDLYNQIPTQLLPAIQKITGISSGDFQKITGVMGLLTPTESKQAIDDKGSTTQVVSKEGQAAAVNAQTAADAGIGKEAQEADKKDLEDASNLSDGGENAATESHDIASTAQKETSSQNILKLLATQHSNQSLINASQLRIGALNNKNLQAIKAQLAISNQSSASQQRIQLSKSQQESLQKERQDNATITNRYRSYDQNF
jgi:hypothetical protein